MKISILSVFPELYTPFLQTSLIGRAQEKGLVSIDAASFFSYVAPKERIDEPTFGHGAGMLMRPEVVEKAVEDKQQKHGKAYKVFFSPHGTIIDQNLIETIVKKASECGHLMLVPGRYEGMDARVEQEYADEIVSIGNFVLMGGDIPAMMLLEGVLRLIPGIVGKSESVVHESFSGPFTDYPEYAPPVVWKGLEVPAVVRSGNHEALKAWRLQEAIKRTVVGHFDWLRKHSLTDDQKRRVKEAIPNHYVILTHTDVLIGKQDKQPGTSSVTSIDIHDIARACATYGIANFFIVTPLLDQQRVVEVLLDFWQKGVGIDYNKNRHEAVKSVRIMNTIDEVIDHIAAQEGLKPLVVATSARDIGQEKRITFSDHKKVWGLKRPVVFLFGTGQGLVQERVAQCDFMFPPLEGLSSFKHLSVRSAVAVVLDRWLGLLRSK